MLLLMFTLKEYFQMVMVKKMLIGRLCNVLILMM